MLARCTPNNESCGVVPYCQSSGKYKAIKKNITPPRARAYLQQAALHMWLFASEKSVHI